MRSLSYDELFIGGRWQAPATGRRITVISPHTEEPIGETPEATHEDVDRAVAAARKAFDDGPWPRLRSRSGWRRSRNSPPSTPRTPTRWPTSSPPRWARRAASAGSGRRRAPSSQMHLNLATAKEFGWVERRQGLFGEVQVRRAPVGVVGAIVPWNVPQVLIMPKLIPALIAGCTVVVKPAPETPLDAHVVGRDDRRDRPAGRCGVDPARRSRDRRGTGSSPGRGQDLVHRIVGHRQAHRRRVRRTAQAGAAWNSAASPRRSSSTTPTSTTPSSHLKMAEPDEQRAGVRGADPDPGQRAQARRGRRRAGRR